MPHPNQPVAVTHPESGGYVTLDPAINYDPDDILVKAYPWAFLAKDTGPGVVESMPIETTTAAPGEKRPRPQR